MNICVTLTRILFHGNKSPKFNTVVTGGVRDLGCLSYINGQFDMHNRLYHIL